MSDQTVKHAPEELEDMEKFGISFDGDKYSFGEYHYRNLQDAINYVKLHNKKNAPYAPNLMGPIEVTPEAPHHSVRSSASLASHHYAIYSHPILGYEVIKNGDSWPAFFLTWIWAFSKKLWPQGIALLLAVFVANSVGFAIAGEGGMLLIVSLLITVIPMFFAGKLGNKWRTASVIERGYKLLAYSMEATPDAALSEVTRKMETQRSKENIEEFIVVDTQTKNTMPDDVPLASEYELYERISHELESGETDRALWTKALAMSEGNLDKQKAIYVKLRASHLKANNKA